MKRDAGSTFYIVTPSYNAAEYLDETIASVVTQAGDFSIHYHIQDGGSTDGTIDKIKAWEERLKSPSPWVFCSGLTFSWDSSPDNGMYDAINKGFERLHIPPEGILAWVNADDPYLPRAFSTVCRFFETAPKAEWVGGKVMWLGEDGGLAEIEGYDYYPREYIAKGLTCSGEWWCIQQNGCFWKASLWRKAGPLDAALRYAADTLIWASFAQHADFHHFATYVGTFRSRIGQLSQHSAYQEELHSRLGATRKTLSLLPLVFSGATCYKSFPVARASGYALRRMYTFPALKLFASAYIKPFSRTIGSLWDLFKHIIKRCLRMM